MFPSLRTSVYESLLILPESLREKYLSSLPPKEASRHNWAFYARPEQILPGTPGAAVNRAHWTYWLALAGRGWGKTRVGAEAVRKWAQKPGEIIHLVAPTAGDVRTVMIEGPSGLLSCYPPEERPAYEPSRRRITFPSGSVGLTFSADEPERLRGPQCTKFWADELCAWRFAEEAWDNLLFGFRLGTDLRGVITTTPKPIKLLKDIVADPHTVVTRGRTRDNRLNLANAFLETIVRKYEGTRLGRQELDAEILEDVQGALWKRGIIDATRWKEAVAQDELVRVVVAIDPAVSTTDESDETGIVVVGQLRNGHILVLDDLTVRESPLAWGKIAIAAYKSRRADMIIGEVNNGGDLVERNIKAIDENVPFRAIHASRGKMVRAEPVANLYEQGRVHHVGFLPQLEDQMCSWVPGLGMKSPDRMDALVWAISEFLDPEPQTATFQIHPFKHISRY